MLRNSVSWLRKILLPGIELIASVSLFVIIVSTISIKNVFSSLWLETWLFGTGKELLLALLLEVLFVGRVVFVVVLFVVLVVLLMFIGINYCILTEVTTAPLESGV